MITLKLNNLQNKNKRLFVCAIVVVFLVFFSVPLYSQINERALFSTQTDTTSKVQNTPKKHEYKPLNVNNDSAKINNNSNRNEYKPLNVEENTSKYESQPNTSHNSNTLNNSNTSNYSNNSQSFDPSALSLIERALQDPSDLTLLAEEELPPADMPDSVYIRRLSAMPAVISMSYNHLVRNYIVYYMQKYPKRTESILGLCNYYLPILEEILDSYNIPLEMRALPIIESALNPVAVSRKGATGMWQFMLGTARHYGLNVNTYVDERRDFIASTHAAAKYLNMLYSMFQDWTLALAAYNCGEGNVQKAIARAGGKNDYWEIYPHLPKETRNYVPIFIAANYMATYYKEHRLEPKEISFSTAIDTFMVNYNLHLKQVSETVKIPFNVLRDLNPQYKRDVIPGNEKPYELRIPTEYTEAFIAKEKEIYGNSRKYFNTNIVVNPTTEKNADKSKNTDKPKTKNESAATQTMENKTTETKSVTEQTTHEVVSGESLGIIAGKYKIKISDLCEWNNLSKTSTIYPGQKLTLYKKVQTPVQNTENKPNTEKSEKYYTIQSGDNFWTIAQKHNVNLDNLLKVNNMTKDSKLMPGQKVLIPN